MNYPFLSSATSRPCNFIQLSKITVSDATSIVYGSLQFFLNSCNFKIACTALARPIHTNQADCSTWVLHVHAIFHQQKKKKLQYLSKDQF